MMLFRFLSRSITVLLLAAILERAQPAGPTEYGPPEGTLIIVGGGRLEGTGILETFINRAGGAVRKDRGRPDGGRQ